MQRKKSGRVVRKVACQGKSISLKCNNGEKIKVRWAVYGRMSRKTCNKGKYKFCRSPSSHRKVKAACNGKSSCKLKASSKMFGNPCPGIHKYLKVTYRCIKWGTRYCSSEFCVMPETMLYFPFRNLYSYNTIYILN